MTRIDFDIKYREQIESGKYKVVYSVDGADHNAEIIKWDAANSEFPIVALMETGIAINYSVNGISSDALCPQLSILTDESEEFTEFEKTLLCLVTRVKRQSLTFNEFVKKYSGELLEAAKKELEKNEMKVIDVADFEQTVKDSYEKGKKDALAYIPTWKQEFSYSIGETWLYKNTLYVDNMSVSVNDLINNLPKSF